VWADAAKWLSEFGEAVLTVIDMHGYPVSVRVDPQAFDATTGQLSAALPDALHPTEGPAGLMCHYHDEKLWAIKLMQIKGRLEKRDGEWTFVSTTFNAPSKLAFVSFITAARSSAQHYLDKRGLSRPDVDWAAIKETQRRVEQRQRLRARVKPAAVGRCHTRAQKPQQQPVG
jgi:hypothetical protein